MAVSCVLHSALEELRTGPAKEREPGSAWGPAQYYQHFRRSRSYRLDNGTMSGLTAARGHLQPQGSYTISV